MVRRDFQYNIESPGAIRQDLSAQPLCQGQENETAGRKPQENRIAGTGTQSNGARRSDSQVLLHIVTEVGGGDDAARFEADEHVRLLLVLTRC